ncbi:unnamed protein product [Musa acuminata subsp. malaccensis]|uniref:(wild Malaysian banana) hypothetical protein n=1 Tax=Musa acuminata subsp. malaccensis TaxID=214687 RepID=A0A804LB16_MUSAM|nr:unnamed protein product [Musa acuminata subsp. malaccensis]
MQKSNNSNESDAHKEKSIGRDILAPVASSVWNWSIVLAPPPCCTTTATTTTTWPDVALRVPPASLLEVGMVYVLWSGSVNSSTWESCHACLQEPCHAAVWQIACGIQQIVSSTVQVLCCKKIMFDGSLDDFYLPPALHNNDW